MRITRSANCMKVTWVERVPKKKNVKPVTGAIAEMPKPKQKAEIIKINPDKKAHFAAFGGEIAQPVAKLTEFCNRLKHRK